MYNQEQKKKFISSLTKSASTAQNAETLFAATGPYEELAGKDICTFSVDELQPVADEVFALRSNGKWLSRFILQEYSKWCIAMGVEGADNSIYHINLLSLGKVKRQMVSGPAHLQRYLDAVYDPEKEETIDNLYRCYLWMAFCGIEDEAALELKASAVDLRSMTILLGDDEIPLYRESIPAFRKAVELTEFTYKHPNYQEIKRQRIPGDELMCGIKAMPRIKPFRVRLSRTLAAAYKEGRTQELLSYERIKLYGLFYRVYEQERAGIPPDFSEAAIKFTEGKNYHLPKGRTIRGIQNSKAKEYMEDYQRWKLAFVV